MTPSTLFRLENSKLISRGVIDFHIQLCMVCMFSNICSSSSSSSSSRGVPVETGGSPTGVYTLFKETGFQWK